MYVYTMYIYIHIHTYSMDLYLNVITPKCEFWNYGSIPSGTAIYGGFHEWGYPNSWMVYKGKSH